MKKITQQLTGSRRYRITLLSLCMAALLLVLSVISPEASASENGAGKQLDILFLHDTHSHLNSFLTVENGTDVTLGGQDSHQ